MNKRIIRYRKQEWKNWVYETVGEKDVEKRIKELEQLGYIVLR